MTTTQISTTLEIDIYKAIKKEGLKWNWLINKGYMAYKDQPQLNERIHGMEHNIERLAKKLSFYASRSRELETRLKKYEEVEAEKLDEE
jgi:hypothetical protein